MHKPHDTFVYVAWLNEGHSLILAIWKTANLNTQGPLEVFWISRVTHEGATRKLKKMSEGVNGPWDRGSLRDAVCFRKWKHIEC